MAARAQLQRLAIYLLATAMLAGAGCGALGDGTPRERCDSADGLPTLCGLRNPEDVEHAERAGIVLVSSMRLDRNEPAGGYITGVVLGEPDRPPVRLWPADRGGAADPDPDLGEPGCATPPEPDSFYPHGIAVRDDGERTWIYVVGHAGDLGGREAIEIFELRDDGADATLAWKACIPTPGAVMANDVAVLPHGGVVASNYAPDDSLWHTIRAALLGTPTGEIISWRPGEGWSTIDNTRSALANGVAIAPDGETLFYTETMTGELHRLRLDATGGKISVDIGGNPDNLTWTSGGTLLVATHTSGAAFMLCTFGKRPCATAWAVYEVDPVTLATSLVLEHDGRDLGAVATALEAGGDIYLGGVYDDRIGVVPLAVARHPPVPPQG